jgi:glycosyltransferase involved in cell wall biosynthesis
MDNQKKENYIKGLVSIIIPTYNRYELLTHSISSCLNQTYKNIEIIVVDDCSTDTRYKDGTLELFDKTKIIHLPINQKLKYNVSASQGMTMQEGINIANGEWIAFLDDDDFFLPNKIELQVNHMKKNNALFSSTNMYSITHKNVSTSKLNITIKNPYFDKNALPHIFDKQLIQQVNYINNSTVMIHREIINKVGDFKPVKFEYWDYWLRTLNYANCYYLDIPLVYYTIDIQNDKSNHIKNYI